MNTHDRAEKIADVALKCKGVDIIEPTEIGEGSWDNELLFFIKPEVFLLSKRTDIVKTTELILKTIEKFDATIEGICAVNGSALDKYKIMSSHYGFINILSNTASKAADAESRKKIEEAFKLKSSEFEILGGHEYLSKFKKESGDELDKVWFAEKSVKIRSGFYVRLLKKDGKNIVLVNGFHPKQLSYFTDTSHNIVLMLLHSNNGWSELKNNMVGATFPEKAPAESIRGILYSHAKEYGFKEVTIANNCVHLSAGPFEAFSEIVNFFGKLANMDLKTEHPLALEKMLSDGISFKDAVKPLENPTLEYGGKKTDLFSATEEKNTEEAIAIFKEGVL